MNSDTELRKLRKIQIARDTSEWLLGDPSWANEIIHAYENPEDARRILEEEGFYE